MKRSLSFLLVTLFAISLSGVAVADTRSASACSAALTIDQKLIYQTVLADLIRDANLSDLIRAKVTALVTAGRLPMSSAPDDAKVASRCLRMVRQ